MIPQLIGAALILSAAYLLDGWLHWVSVIDASTDVGSDLARIFTGFATKEYGERSVLIERTQPSGCACASKHRAAPAATEAGVAV